MFAFLVHFQFAGDFTLYFKIFWHIRSFSDYTSIKSLAQTVSSCGFKDTQYLLCSLMSCEKTLQIVNSPIPIVTFYKVTTNRVSKQWNTAPRRNRELGSSKPLVTRFHQPINIWSCFVCFCLKILYLIHVNSLCQIRWFTNIELTANRTITHSWIKLLTYEFFSIRNITAFFALSNTIQHFSTTCGTHFTQAGQEQKHKNAKKKSH